MESGDIVVIFEGRIPFSRPDMSHEMAPLQ